MTSPSGVSGRAERVLFTLSPLSAKTVPNRHVNKSVGYNMARRRRWRLQEWCQAL